MEVDGPTGRAGRRARKKKEGRSSAGSKSAERLTYSAERRSEESDRPNRSRDLDETELGKGSSINLGSVNRLGEGALSPQQWVEVLQAASQMGLLVFAQEKGARRNRAG